VTVAEKITQAEAWATYAGVLARGWRKMLEGKRELFGRSNMTLVVQRSSHY
jgi:hypothetical protein